ncbi:MAG: flagellar hook-basal body complex protein FliE [Clostridiales bacterium]|jgi:flagellar hook-basal body complex protein FliE|nr:flagellar hook-basal body complex protein FliE [Clostridiales bacterium]
MEITGIQIPIAPAALDYKLLGQDQAAEKTGGLSFDSFLQAYMAIYNETDANIQNAQTMQLDVAAGRSDDIIGLTLATEKATSSLNFTVQITNRILEAYREIIRIQM